MSGVRSNILKLNYDLAWDNLKEALAFPVAGKNPINGLDFLEVAYVFNEMGRYAQADSAGRLAADILRARVDFDRGAESVSRERRNVLRNALRQINPAYVDTLRGRYFPEMVSIRGGTFWMGCDQSEEGLDCEKNELPRRRVKIDDYYIARTETTIWQYYIYCENQGKAIDRYFDPSKSDSIGPMPVVDVSWFETVDYANWLSGHLDLEVAYAISGNDIEVLDWQASGFRLATEAEWEYAARGGPRGEAFLFCGSDQIDKVAWYSGNSAPAGPRPVGSKEPNDFGIYDMSGNVFEWCWDLYDEYPQSPASAPIENPRGPAGEGYAASRLRVLRGGSWRVEQGRCRVSFRDSGLPQTGIDGKEDYGFRLVSGR